MDLSIIVKIKYYDKHLDDCVKSVLLQDFLKYEIIFVSNKHNKHIDVFLLNILNNYSKVKNLVVVQETSKDFNDIVNKAISVAQGKYIHIIDQNTLVLENTYYEFLKLQEQFKYDLYVFDYITITENINYSEVYKRYNKSLLKIQNKEYKKQHIKNLKESGLVFDFSKYSKENYNNLFIKTKGFKYNTSNIYESIQRLDTKYKMKLLALINIKEFNIIIKKDLLFNVVFVFPDIINSNIDLYKRLLLINNITCVKNTLVCNYEIKTKNNILKKVDIDLQEIIYQSKLRYKQVIDKYKKNPKVYFNKFDFIEYLIFLELLNFNDNNIDLNIIDKQIYIKEIYEYLTELLPNYKENKHFNSSFYKRFKLNNQVIKLEKYLKQDLNKNLKVKTTKELIKTEKKTKKQAKIDKKTQKAKEDLKLKQEKKLDKKHSKEEKQLKEKIYKEKTYKDKTYKEKRNIFKVLYRKLNFDINKIKRTRLNENIVKYFKIFKVKVLKFILLIKDKFKELIYKVLRVKQPEVFQIKETQILLLDTPKEDIEILKELKEATTQKEKEKLKL